MNEIAAEEFRYWRVPFSEWGPRLSILKERGSTRVRVPIPWGVHEGAPGARDFSRSPRLRLEKLFSLALERDLSVEIIVGFSPLSDAFPSWFKDESAVAVVPSVLAEENSRSRALVTIPSVHSKSLQDAFIAFLQELGAVLSLYRSPDGPISDVILDLTPYDTDQSLLSNSDFHRAFRLRYSDPLLLRQRYQLQVSNAETLCTPAGFRRLSESRPWLFAFDYHSCRRRLCAEAFEKIAGACPAAGIQTLRPAVQPPPKSGLTVLVESTCVDWPAPNFPFPLSAEGAPTDLAIQNARIADWFLQFSRLKEAGFIRLDGGPISNSLGDRGVVVCGKYLGRSDFEFLRLGLQAGKRLFFPLGLPMYDETLTPLGWPAARGRSNSTAGDWVRFPAEAGEISRLSPPPSYGRLQNQDLWQVLS